jgi:SAM-dependent methyltransferase
VTDSARYTRVRTAHWDAVAREKRPQEWSAAYHRRLVEVYCSIVAPGLRVLEVGCGRGDLLAALQPAVGVGVDLSQEMITAARACYPSLKFLRGDAHTLELREPFDVVILSDLVNDLWDVEVALKRVEQVTEPGSRLILNFFSLLWEQPLNLARSMGLAKPLLEQNWLTVEDVSNLLGLADLEVTRHWDEVLLPLDLRPLDRLANRYLARVWPFTQATLTHFVVARPKPRPAHKARPVVSVVIPARNEAGNIPAIFDRTPKMGGGTELIFVEGHSKDDTYGAISHEIKKHPDRQVQLLKQTGRGKGDAVRLGFAHARGDVLMILDADLTVAPEDLPRFLQALCSGKGELINGVRLVYPMEKQAMRFFNLLGNKFFSLAFSWLLGQSIKDTLCGTKVLWAADYRRIAAQRAYFGDFDPFGDFDLLFGAAKLNLKIVDLPIRYRERTYGTTNIQRWRHGLLLLRMVLFAARRIKFV